MPDAKNDGAEASQTLKCPRCDGNLRPDYADSECKACRSDEGKLAEVLRRVMLVRAFAERGQDKDREAEQAALDHIAPWVRLRERVRSAAGRRSDDSEVLKRAIEFLMAKMQAGREDVLRVPLVAVETLCTDMPALKAKAAECCVDTGKVTLIKPACDAKSPIGNRRERSERPEIEAAAQEHYTKLWKITNATEWGRQIGAKLGRDKPVDYRTVKKLETWKRAEQRRQRTANIRDRMIGHGISEQFLDSLGDTRNDGQTSIIDKLDAGDRQRLQDDDQLRSLVEAQIADDACDVQHPGA